MIPPIQPWNYDGKEIGVGVVWKATLLIVWGNKSHRSLTRCLRKKDLALAKPPGNLGMGHVASSKERISHEDAKARRRKGTKESLGRSRSLMLLN